MSRRDTEAGTGNRERGTEALYRDGGDSSTSALRAFARNDNRVPSFQASEAGCPPQVGR